MSEFQKAFEDMVMFGTGIIEVKEDGISHVSFDEVSNETYEETLRTPVAHSPSPQPMNRKQRRIKASKDRRNGKNKV
jgi:c-di-GMP-binding flagellar brake protein YcgR